ncbi:MAG TPA: hypothetical protein VFF73_19970 [Planctomycetota bacterium]|nr:hypothetical protein [Planctomycetota bacterium]
MVTQLRLRTPVSADMTSRNLGDYAPADGDLPDSLTALVRVNAREAAPRIVSEDGGDLELRAVFLRLESDTEERPFACAQVLVEVVRLATRQTIYTRKVESEVRRLIQEPVPLDDPRFSRTALGRATHSCLRSLFTALADTFGGV